MESVNNTIVKLKCPVKDCQWRYESGFCDELSFKLIVMHVDIDHTAQQSRLPIIGQEPKQDLSLQCPKKRQHGTSKSQKRHPLNPSPMIICPNCKSSMFQRFNGKNRIAFEYCIQCFQNSPTTSILSNHTAAAKVEDGAEEMLCDDVLNSIVLEGKLVTPCDAGSHSSMCNLLVREHPMTTIRLCPVGKSEFISVNGIADTGAQSNLWGLKDFLEAGFEKSDLCKVSLRISAANKQPLPIIGGFMAKLEGDAPDGEVISCQAMIFVSKSVSGLFISFDTLIRLRVVNSRFPIIGGCPANDKVSAGTHNPVGYIRSINSGCLALDEPCKCPQRSAVPIRPRSLPFKPVPANNGKMKEWLLDYFSASTFNTCPHRPLQEMTGPPIQIHMEPDAEPRVCKTPAVVSLHWQERVERDIRQDVALGILEEVPYGVPVTWCHRMVVTRKHDGTP